VRKLIAALTLSTAALAGTSTYLWAELREARGRVEMLSRAPPSAPASAVPGGAMSAAATSADSSHAAEVRPVGDHEKARQELDEEEYRDNARRRLAQLTDPAMRAQVVEEWKEANLPLKAKYARYLGISDADAERLIDILADQHVAQEEAFARCTLQPPCNYGAAGRESNAARQAAVTELLGTEKQQRLDEYEYTGIERSMVSPFLRDRIPAGSPLTDEQSERLVAALADERKLVETEIKQSGSEPFSSPMEGVAFTFSNSIFDGNTAGRLKEAADFNERIHARAKAILTPPQLAAFEQMQEQAMVGIKSQLQQVERDRVTRGASAEGR
jgi:hypothetical protein